MPPTRRPRTQTPSAPASRPARAGTAPSNRVAVVGAGMAGVVCARTLAQAGHRVSVFDKSLGAGGRMATRETEFGGFDHGAQYFTVRDPRFQQALQATTARAVPWQANTVRVLDPLGQTLASATASETHWVPVPGMNALVRSWAAPLADGSLGAELRLDAKAVRIERDALHPAQWQLRTEGRDGSQHVHGGFDRIVLAMPHLQAAALLQASALAPQIRQTLAAVSVRPCWTLMIAFPQAMQPGLTAFGPRWHAARSSSHRVCWLARESSKPGRGPVERWTVQASPVWSAEHHEDDPERVKAKLLKGFAEITGIRATPSHATVHRWNYAQTHKPLGRPYAWDARLGIGLCGDWCLGHRVEDAFVSGLELALALA